MIRPRALVTLLLVLAAATIANAQTAEPIGPFALDARVALPRFKQDTNVATALGVQALDLPSRGLGLAFSAHLYPVRKGPITFGFGAEFMTSRGSRTQETDDQTVGQTVETRFSNFSPQISFNFGAKQGWSYISGGLGWGSFTTELADLPVPEAEGRLTTINYGGGARWFLNQHVAVSLDLRFYAVDPQEASLGRPAYPRMTIMAFSAGLALK
jgi:hypothetical protein